MHQSPVQLGEAPMAPPVPGPARALAKSRASHSVSVMSSGNGQVSPAASNRRIVNRTADGAVPTRRAISRVGIPADFNLITSRISRIASLSVGIQAPFAKPKGDTVSEPEEASSPRATSSRKGGRHRAESAGGTSRHQTSVGLRMKAGDEVVIGARLVEDHGDVVVVRLDAPRGVSPVPVDRSNVLRKGRPKQNLRGEAARSARQAHNL